MLTVLLLSYMFATQRKWQTQSNHGRTEICRRNEQCSMGGTVRNRYFGATILRSNIKVVATDRGLMYEDYVYPLVL